MTALPRWPRRFVLAAGPAACLLGILAAPDSLPDPARPVFAVTLWMVVWWLTEAVPLAVTALLPLALFPTLGVMSTRDAAAPYASELVFLFLAGFLLAAALEYWRAHARLAYGLVAAVGVGARRIVLGVMLATAFLSMWISNTATAAMMYPIAIAIGGLLGEGAGPARTRTALMLGVAYAASIGGMATLIGTPPNLLFAASAAELLDRPVGFGAFMMVGLPIVVVLLPLCWWLLVGVLFRGNVESTSEARAMLSERRRALGPLRGGERRTLIVFGLTALGWLLREPKAIGVLRLPGLTDLAPQISDASVGLLGAVVLFVVTGGAADGGRRPLLTWAEARRIPWDVLLLFGGGISLAAAMEASGLTVWLGDLMGGLAALPDPLIYAGIATLVLLLSELASNTATAAMVMPLAFALAPSVGLPPLALMLVASLAASTGFALPIATPPNAIVFGSGQVGVRDMARAGVLLDLLAIVVVVGGVLLLYPVVFG